MLGPQCSPPGALNGAALFETLPKARFSRDRGSFFRYGSSHILDAIIEAIAVYIPFRVRQPVTVFIA